MRKLVFIAVLCAFVATPVLADFHGVGYDGGTAKWDRKDGYYAGGGGEFTIWGSGLELSNSAYADSTSGLAWDSKGGSESFQSFCMEVAEHIYEPMEIWVSTENAAGTGPGSHAWKGGTGLGDDLGAETAYLYTQFATGSLSGYAYTGTVGGLDRSQTSGALQRLIWNIEGEGGSLTAGDEHYGITLTTAQANLISSWQTAYGDSEWTGIGDVRVLQMYEYLGNDCYGLKQDQLYLTPAPAAVLLGMLGLGIAGIKLRKYA